MKPAPLLAWPGWRHIGHTALLALAVSIWFQLIFTTTNYWTGLHHYRVRLHLDAERSIPFVPAAVLGYLSIYLLFAATPFILRDQRAVRALAATLMLTTFIAGIGFLLMPGELQFEAADDPGRWAGLVAFARRIALRYNLAPSLHVALAVVCAGAFAGRARWTGKLLLCGWTLAIALSTLLLHQHHLVDVVTGYGLGLATLRWGYWRWLSTSACAAESNSSPQPVQESSATGLIEPAFCPRARHRRS
jgi:membrane-associated phospholipid phosphatase